MSFDFQKWKNRVEPDVEDEGFYNYFHFHSPVSERIPQDTELFMAWQNYIDAIIKLQNLWYRD